MRQMCLEGVGHALLQAVIAAVEETRRQPEPLRQCMAVIAAEHSQRGGQPSARMVSSASTVTPAAACVRGAPVRGSMVWV